MGVQVCNTRHGPRGMGQREAERRKVGWLGAYKNLLRQQARSCRPAARGRCSAPPLPGLPHGGSHGPGTTRYLAARKGPLKVEPPNQETVSFGAALRLPSRSHLVNNDR